jgi:hypothetical protein
MQAQHSYDGSLRRQRMRYGFTWSWMHSLRKQNFNNFDELLRISISDTQPLCFRIEMQAQHSYDGSLRRQRMRYGFTWSWMRSMMMKSFFTSRFKLLMAARIQSSEAHSANKIAYYDSRLCKTSLSHTSTLPSNTQTKVPYNSCANRIVTELDIRRAVQCEGSSRQRFSLQERNEEQDGQMR